MITSVRFDGYRLLDRFEADLGSLNVVIGANACGKSSLLDALSLIAHSMDLPVEDALSLRGGMWSIPNCGRDCDEIGWQITFHKPTSHALWSRIPVSENQSCVYEARIGRDRTGRVEHRYECLRYAEPRPGKSTPFKMLESDRARTRVFDPATGTLTRFDEPRPKSTKDAAELETFESPAQKATLALANMRFENQFPIPTWVRSFVANQAYYPGFDMSRRSAVRANPAELRPEVQLFADGSNLGTVLHELFNRHEHRELADELREWFTTAYPQAQHISTELAYGGEPRVLVRVREAGLQRGTEIWELSDGMLRFLLLCVALSNPLASFIAIDEPELGLHPRLLPILADAVKAAAERTQVLVATHSPQFLDCFGLDDVAVLTRDRNQARWSRPSSRATLRQMLESQLGGTLGDLHAAGELEAMA